MLSAFRKHSASPSVSETPTATEGKCWEQHSVNTFLHSFTHNPSCWTLTYTAIRAHLPHWYISVCIYGNWFMKFCSAFSRVALTLRQPRGSHGSVEKRKLESCPAAGCLNRSCSHFTEVLSGVNTPEMLWFVNILIYPTVLLPSGPHSLVTSKTFSSFFCTEFQRKVPTCVHCCIKAFACACHEPLNLYCFSKFPGF